MLLFYRQLPKVAVVFAIMYYLVERFQRHPQNHVIDPVDRYQGVGLNNQAGPNGIAKAKICENGIRQKDTVYEKERTFEINCIHTALDSMVSKFSKTSFTPSENPNKTANLSLNIENCIGSMFMVYTVYCTTE
jgi:hypothetical protein